MKGWEEIQSNAFNRHVWIKFIPNATMFGTVGGWESGILFGFNCHANVVTFTFI